MNKRIHEWMNEWMKQWMDDEWVKKNELSQWMNERTKEWTHVASYVEVNSR